MNGVVIIDKPVGIASATLGRKLAKILGIAKVGHAGTLDPFASGILPLCFGEATKISHYLMVHEKTYEAQIQLGQATNTFDKEGEIVSEGEIPPDLNEEKINDFLKEFQGSITQKPPVFSAKKIQGIPSYRLARAGQNPDLPEMKVQISECRLISWDKPLLHLKIRCSKGTYIRSLAHDLGQRMGCGAHLAALRRTVHGGFSLKNALVWPPEALLGPNSIEKEHEEYFRAKMPQFLIPLNGALAHLPAIALNDQQVPYIRQGRSLQSIWLGKLFGPVIPKTEHSDGVFKVLNDQEDLVALVTVDRGRDRLASIYPPRFKYLRVFN